LVHHPSVDREGRELTTAVTPLDLHDLARLARTYGLGGVYATTPLAAQRAVVDRLLRHWTEGHGAEANPCRREALLGLRVVEDIAAAARDVLRRFGAEPLLVATSAREGAQRLPLSSARRMLAPEERPVLLLFGTGWGLAPAVLDACDWVLEPVQSSSGYNHLSVRSAASIYLDRLINGNF
jgi:tRNA (guanine37-N1)-methyltransferase